MLTTSCVGIRSRYDHRQYNGRLVVIHYCLYFANSLHKTRSLSWSAVHSLNLNIVVSIISRIFRGR